MPMSAPILFTAIVGLLAVALVGIGLRSRARSSKPDIARRIETFARVSDAPVGAEIPTGRREINRFAKNLDGLIKGKSMAERLAELLARADVRMTAGELLMLRLTVSLGGFAVGYLASSGLAPALALVPALFGALAGYA